MMNNSANGQTAILLTRLDRARRFWRKVMLVLLVLPVILVSTAIAVEIVIRKFFAYGLYAAGFSYCEWILLIGLALMMVIVIGASIRVCMLINAHPIWPILGYLFLGIPGIFVTLFLLVREADKLGYQFGPLMKDLRPK